MKGIILAGGTGSRLHPMTAVVNKQLLPVYDKPMIHYPLSVLMLAGIRDILIITTPDDQPLFQKLLGDGKRIGLNLSYAAQPRPEGLAQAYLIGREFLAGEPCAMILGDNIFFGHGLVDMLNSAAARKTGATVFANWVAEPERYGVIKMDKDGKPLEVIEKPKEAVSNWAVTGLYFFDGRASDIAAEVKPSARGELEIVDIINTYLAEGALSVERLGRGFAWLDTGTPQTLLQAASFAQTLEERQGLKISCVEEIAYRKGFIGIDDLKKLAADLKGNAYAQYLEKVIRGTD
jgi:glucose-1-phosphate thymidylyltransferase